MKEYTIKVRREERKVIFEYEDDAPFGVWPEDQKNLENNHPFNFFIYPLVGKEEELKQCNIHVVREEGEN